MATPAPAPAPRPDWRGHVEILRIDHGFKNVFVLPGVAAVCLIASSYYTLNEILDAPHDWRHPLKQERAAASGRVHRGWGTRSAECCCWRGWGWESR